MTETSFELLSATNTLLLPRISSDVGAALMPAVLSSVWMTDNEAMSITETESEPSFGTYARLPSAVMWIRCGRSPTGIDAASTSPAFERTVTVPAASFATSTSAWSGVSAMPISSDNHVGSDAAEAAAAGDGVHPYHYWSPASLRAVLY